jgi:putative sigma-54 modulation protein
MQISTTFRHMEASPAVRDYAEERLDKIRKYFQRELLSAHATFSVERNHNHTAEFSLTLPNGIVLQARETTEDMYSSVDLAAARIERQVRKWKERIRTHKPHGGPSFSIRQAVITPESFEPQPGEEDQADKAKVERAGKVHVVRERTVEVRSMSVEDAAMQLNLMEKEFLVFTDVDSKAISVIYRRKDGNYGLIETGAPAPGA